MDTASFTMHPGSEYFMIKLWILVMINKSVKYWYLPKTYVGIVVMVPHLVSTQFIVHLAISVIVKVL